jgi:hypothetical protein
MDERQILWAAQGVRMLMCSLMQPPSAIVKALQVDGVLNLEDARKVCDKYNSMQPDAFIQI